MKERYQFYADLFNGHEEDGDPQPKAEKQSDKSLVIGTRVKEKDLWHRLRHFLWRV